MCMMELATKTMMADSRIGSQSAVRGTMRSLLRLRGRMHRFPTREATLARSRGQEGVPRGITGPASAQWRGAGPRPAPALCTSSLISLAVYLPRALSLERNGGTLIQVPSHGAWIDSGGSEKECRPAGATSTSASATAFLASDRASSITGRSEEHTSELQSRENLVCRL